MLKPKDLNIKLKKAWADLLNLDGVKKFENYRDNLGGNQNFRLVLRRNTGVVSAGRFANAVKVLDAIDIFTMAKLHSGNKNSSAPEDKLTENVLKGVNFNEPSKYKNITLKDILVKVSVDDGDWKATLKNSITDANSLHFKSCAKIGKTRMEKKDDVA